jgi:hypothetical protein
MPAVRGDVNAADWPVSAIKPMEHINEPENRFPKAQVPSATIDLFSARIGENSIIANS